MDIPPLTQEPIKHVDATPDEGYALRILRAYRENCNCRWEYIGDSKTSKELIEAINHACEERGRILDEAIAILENTL